LCFLRLFLSFGGIPLKFCRPPPTCLGIPILVVIFAASKSKAGRILYARRAKSFMQGRHAPARINRYPNRDEFCHFRAKDEWNYAKQTYMSSETLIRYNSRVIRDINMKIWQYAFLDFPIPTWFRQHVLQRKFGTIYITAKKLQHFCHFDDLWGFNPWHNVPDRIRDCPYLFLFENYQFYSWHNVLDRVRLWMDYLVGNFWINNPNRTQFCFEI